jgi:hypothetical protein
MANEFHPTTAAPRNFTFLAGIISRLVPGLDRLHRAHRRHSIATGCFSKADIPLLPLSVWAKSEQIKNRI